MIVNNKKIIFTPVGHNAPPEDGQSWDDVTIRQVSSFAKVLWRALRRGPVGLIAPQCICPANHNLAPGMTKLPYIRPKLIKPEIALN